MHVFDVGFKFGDMAVFGMIQPQRQTFLCRLRVRRVHELYEVVL